MLVSRWERASVFHRLYSLLATGKPIGKARLEAKPWANYCIEYARMLEQGLITSADESHASEEDTEEEEA